MSQFFPSLRLGALACLLFSLAACQQELSYQVEGNGQLLFEPAGSDCKPAGDNCRRFNTNTSLKVTPLAAPGYEFYGWQQACTGLGFCQLKLKQAETLSAVFVPSEQAQLTEVSSDLEQVLEHGRLEGACQRYFAAPEQASRFLQLACGKSLFFNEGFDLLGVPAAIADYLQGNFPNSVGPGFSKLGLTPNPFDDKQRAIGLVPGAPLGKSQVPTVAFGCASCHFSKMPDGRYAIGAPNHDYDYGKHILSMAVFPLALMGGAVDPELVAKFLPDLALPPLEASDAARASLDDLFEEFAQTPSIQPKLLGALIPMAGLVLNNELDVNLFALDEATQDQYASWGPTGNQDFIIRPVGLDDSVHTISKIPSLWHIPTRQQMLDHGGEAHAQLGYTGGTADINNFVKGFVALSLGPEGKFDEAYMKPLVEYLLQLKAPQNPNPLDAAKVAAGQQLFADKGCLACHDGPAYSSTARFDFDEIGTDNALMYWNDFDLDGVPEANILTPEKGDIVTHQIKAPRLVGSWTFKRFLHNGSVDSLEDLFCIDHARPSKTALAYGDQGHDYTCGNLSLSEKQNLIEFILSL